MCGAELQDFHVYHGRNTSAVCEGIYRGQTSETDSMVVKSLHLQLSSEKCCSVSVTARNTADMKTFKIKNSLCEGCLISPRIDQLYQPDG